MPDEGVPRHERDALEPAIGVCIVESLVLHPQRQVDIFEQAPTVPLNEIPTRLAVNTPYSYGAQVLAKPPLHLFCANLPTVKALACASLEGDSSLCALGARLLY